MVTPTIRASAIADRRNQYRKRSVKSAWSRPLGKRVAIGNIGHTNATLNTQRIYRNSSMSEMRNASTLQKANEGQACRPALSSSFL
jgi:hypothetical protein